MRLGALLFLTSKFAVEDNRWSSRAISITSPVNGPKAHFTRQSCNTTLFLALVLPDRWGM